MSMEEVQQGCTARRCLSNPESVGHHGHLRSPLGNSPDLHVLSYDQVFNLYAKDVCDP